MSTKKGNPGCPCCDVCKIDRLTAETEVTQDTIRDAEHPQAPYPSWLQAEVKAVDGAVARLYLAWDDSTPGDGIYIEFTPDSPNASSGEISVYTKDDRKIAGPLYVRGGVSDEWHTFTICYDPDKIPDQLVIAFDPSDADIETQQFSVIVPDVFSAGRKAGYGTGNATGDVSVRNYNYDRLWYCGDGTEDCHKYADSWDYYYDLPSRTVCHDCKPCPAGPKPGTAADWTILAGTWTDDKALETYSQDARIISIVGSSGWQISNGIPITLYPADEGIVGWSDILGRNQVYIKVTHNAASYMTVAVGSMYDEEYDRFYVYLAAVSALIGAGTTLTYSFYKVADGGAASLVSGPHTVSSVVSGMQYVLLADDYITLHAVCRQAMFGTGTVGGSRKVTFGGSFNQCNCGGGSLNIPAIPRKYTAVVSGVVQGTYQWGGQYFDHTLLNRSVTLRNYFHLTPGDPFMSPSAPCTHSEHNSTYDSQTMFYGQRVGETVVLHGYAWAWSIGMAVQVHFRKVLYGEVDLRNLSGEVLEFADVTTPYVPLVDASNATLTITSVP